jgi:hypothetical protein
MSIAETAVLALVNDEAKQEALDQEERRLRKRGEQEEAERHGNGFRNKVKREEKEILSELERKHEGK